MPVYRPPHVIALVAAVLVVLAATATASTAVGGDSNGSSQMAAAAGIVRGPDGALLPVVGTFAGSQVVSSTCGQEVVYEGGIPLEGPVDVVLDPGHGGPETGSVGANGLVERDLNLLVALQ